MATGTKMLGAETGARPHDTDGQGRTPSPSRLIIEAVSPEIDGGAFPIKRTVGEVVEVSADIFADGHDLLCAAILHRRAGEPAWTESRLMPLPNDRWEGQFRVGTELGEHEYTLQAWVDRFGSWRRDLAKKAEAGLEVSSELLEGAELIRETARRIGFPEAPWLDARAELIAGEAEQTERVAAALDPDLAERMDYHADRSNGVTYDRVLRVLIERERARFGSWYEMFPRSASPEPGRHGTFRDVEALLPYVAGMGFDVLYLPPIHPVGRSFRKGRNNSLTPEPGDVGSPWAIGGPEGGHKSIHPELGTLDDFDRLVARAAEHGLEIALDIAFQCSPDHPYVREHPGWFRHRPDGTIKYAENPPKKYQDIYPLNFECDDWQGLWNELLDVFLFWAGHGVKIFRVDNPHTKPFRFWDWVIAELRRRHPDVILLAEAFTRPKIMKRLAKGGYPQSYSYFTWRNRRREIEEYFTELTQTECVDYMRPNLFANTPDILHEYLQTGGRPGFLIREVLAATLGASYGIYGPPFELCVGTPVKRGSEEYLDSEKYQIVHWNREAPHSLRDFIGRVNRIRRENPALQFDRNLRFFHADNDSILCYGKLTPDRSNAIVVVVSLDPTNVQSGWVNLPIEELGLGSGPDRAYEVHDLIDDARYVWHGEWNFVRLNPDACPAHIFRVEPRQGIKPAP